MEKVIHLNELHFNQQKVVDGHDRFSVLSCGRRWGKSKLAENLLCEPAIDGKSAAYFAPTYKLLNEVFRSCMSLLLPITTKSNQSEKRIDLITGGIIDFWSLDSANAGRGRKYHRAVIDEAAFVKELWTSWTEQIRPTLTDYKGDAWFMSTPKGKNDFHKIFQRGISGDPGWNAWQMSTYDNPYIDPTEIDDARKDLPELAFSQEYLAEFNENVANPFGAMFIQQCTYPMSNKIAVCYGIDLAKSYDYTVIIGLDEDATVCHFQRFQEDWRTTKQRIINLAKAPILMDSTGVGDPIFEDLQLAGVDVTGYKFSSTSKQQLMTGLANAIQQRKIAFPDGAITAELNIFEYEFTANGVKYSAPAGFHDDCVMALALAYNNHSIKRGSGRYSFA